MRNSIGGSPLVVFDGACGFCSRVVLFILRYEKGERFLFCSNSSPHGIELLERHGLQDLSRSTIIVIEDEKVLVRSDAVLHIAAHLRPPFSWLTYGSLVPRVMRDLVYRLIASIRHLLPGTRNVCQLLPPNKQARIIEGNVRQRDDRAS